MILDQIVAKKRKEVEVRKRELPLMLIEDKVKSLSPTRNFKAALQNNSIKLIAEIKRASPSAGIIRDDFDPVQIASTYQENGAAAISVLTETEYFQGSLDHLRKVKQATNIPILRKDFIFDEYQIYESRVCGADAVLLIAAILELEQLSELVHLVQELGMTSLVEVHTEEELNKVLMTEAKIIGINNRNLDTLEVDLSVTSRLRKLIPLDRIVISESGIRTREDMVKLESLKVNAALIGETLMSSEDIGRKVRELLGKEKWYGTNQNHA